MTGNIIYADVDNTILYSKNGLESNTTLPMIKFTMFYSPEQDKIGIFYDGDFSNVDLYYRYGDEDFKCKKNINKDMFLNLPKDKEYLDGYVEVKDKYGNIGESNIVTFYAEGTDYYEKIKDSDGDGIGDAYEIRDLNTNPYLADSDGNGIIDAYDIYDDKEYYDIRMSINKDEYEQICSTVGNIFYLENATDEEYNCYPKKSKIDIVRHSYNEEGILITTVYNKITGQTVLKYYDDKYIKNIYNNSNQIIAILADDGDNNVSKIYDYNNDGKLMLIKHNDFTYELEYNEQENVSVNIAGKTLIDFEYDNIGNVSKVVYGNGQNKNVEYDDMGNVLKILEDENCLYEWEYGKYYMLNKYIDNVNGVITEYSYDEDGMLSSIKDNKDRSINYIYRNDGTGKIVKVGTKEYKSDYIIEENCYKSEFNNVLTKETNCDEDSEQTISILYKDGSIVEINEKYTDNTITRNIGDEEYKYIFSEDGNLLEEYVNGYLKNAYKYDNFSQIVRVDSREFNATITYEYDKGGNISCERVYELSFDVETSELSNEIKCNYYGYDFE